MPLFPSPNRRWLVLLSLAFVAGCGDSALKTYPIPGKLVYDDGSPVPGASIVLQSTVGDQTVSARGVASADGRFTLTTFEEGDGVVAGEHTVAVSPLPPGDSAAPTAAKPIAAQYGDFSTSGLTTTVTPETPEIVITLDRAGPK